MSVGPPTRGRRISRACFRSCSACRPRSQARLCSCTQEDGCRPSRADLRAPPLPFRRRPPKSNCPTETVSRRDERRGLECSYNEGSIPPATRSKLAFRLLRLLPGCRPSRADLRAPPLPFRRRPPQSNYPPGTVPHPDDGMGLGRRRAEGGIPRSAPPGLAPGLRSLPPILYATGQRPMPSCSEGSRGLSVLPRVSRISKVGSTRAGARASKPPAYPLRDGPAANAKLQ